MGIFSLPIAKVDNGLKSRRSVPYDLKRVGDPECDAVFLRALSSAPSIPLVVEPTSHCRLLDEIVVGAACNAYPFEKVRKKNLGSAISRFSCSTTGTSFCVNFKKG